MDLLTCLKKCNEFIEALTFQEVFDYLNITPKNISEYKHFLKRAIILVNKDQFSTKEEFYKHLKDS